MSSPREYALPAPALDKPDVRGEADFAFVPHRLATASHGSRLTKLYTGPQFQPGISWPDKSRSARLVSATPKSKLAGDYVQKYLHMPCPCAPTSTFAAPSAHSATTPVPSPSTH
ncbi:hypothetical protein Y032_0425g1227 [Ancylostoma ceylanicum]|uniref:Uncharacterized protein n=1 Tax=Ancylostoma ceylanicum TaxID=53326 RepID=A0A016X0A9_9BILA|nr:hypothetical protein Y032_0425g1227 [Ancylostoma ceylanicum]